ncbi:MAG: ribosome maturation factor RimM [Snowella sp.]|nr:ribosome maturation factor RimM [Snowella sp.]
MNNQMVSDEWLEVGTIVSPQGLQGEVKVLSLSDFPERFIKKGERWLRSPKGETPQLVNLKYGRNIPGKNLYIVKLAEINSREQAEALKSYKLLVPIGDRVPLAKDEYHVADLIDLEVYLQETGELVGYVRDIFSTGHDLLEVELIPKLIPKILSETLLETEEAIAETEQVTQKKPKTILIPFVMTIVPIVDIANKRIEITPPPGLLDL